MYKLPGTCSCLLIDQTLRTYCKSVIIGEATAIPYQVNGQCFSLFYSLQEPCIIHPFLVLPHTGRVLIPKFTCPVDFEINNLNRNGNEPVAIVATRSL